MAIHRNSSPILQFLLLCVECFSVDAMKPIFFIEPYDVKQVFFDESSFSENPASTLSCGVEYLQGGSVAWYKNGKQISNNDTMYGNIVDLRRYAVEVFAESTWVTFNLKIRTSASRADMDSGNYHCRVMTTPPVISREASFAVFAIPRYGYLQCAIGDDPNDDVFDVIEGIEIRLSCRSDPTGVPEMTTYWTGEGPQGEILDTRTTRSNDTDIRDGSRVLLCSWTATKRQNGATFICIGIHPGYNRNRTCQLGPFNVLYRPIVQLSPSSFTVTMESQMVNFTCIADANPPVIRYHWSNTAGEKFSLHGDNVIVGPNGIWIQMKNFTSQDNGVYIVTCYAENEIGRSMMNATSNFTVNIHTLTTLKTVRKHLSTATIKLDATISKSNKHIPSDGQHDMISVTQVGGYTSYSYGINKTAETSQTRTAVIVGSAVGCGFIFAVVVFVLITECVCKSRKKSQRNKFIRTHSASNPDEDSTVNTRMFFENTDTDREDAIQALDERSVVVRIGKPGTTSSAITAQKINNVKTDTENEMAFINKDIDQRSETEMKQPMIPFEPNQHRISNARLFSQRNTSIYDEPVARENNTENKATTELEGQLLDEKFNAKETDFSVKYASVDRSKKRKREKQSNMANGNNDDEYQED